MIDMDEFTEHEVRKILTNIQQKAELTRHDRDTRKRHHNGGAWEGAGPA
jgi:hypothetical protein